MLGSTEEEAGRKEEEMEVVRIRAIDVYDNIKNYGMWDFKSYSMCKAEGDVCLDALKKRIPISPEMMCDGDYYFCPACKSGVNQDHNFCSGCGQALKWG